MAMESSEVFPNRSSGAESATGLAYCTGERQGERGRHNLPLETLATCTQPVVEKLSRLIFPISAVIDDVSEVCPTLVGVAVLDCPSKVAAIDRRLPKAMSLVTDDKTNSLVIHNVTRRIADVAPYGAGNLEFVRGERLSVQ